MKDSSETPPLTTVQQCVVNALAAGSTLTAAAAAHGVHRVTVYRWMKSSEPFGAALRRAQAEFILARRDDLFELSSRALETLLAILNNPKSSPAVLLKTAMFILTRPQLPKTGWTMPEPAPCPGDNKLLDSAIIEQDYADLSCLASIEYGPEPNEPIAAQTPAEPVASAPPHSAGATECYAMQHKIVTREDVMAARRALLRDPDPDAQKFHELAAMIMALRKQILTPPDEGPAARPNAAEPEKILA